MPAKKSIPDGAPKRTHKNAAAAPSTPPVPSSPAVAPVPDPYAKLKKNQEATKSSATKLKAFLQAAVRGAELKLASDSTLAKLYELEVATHFMRAFRESDNRNLIELAGKLIDPGNVLDGPGGPQTGKGKTITVVLPGKPELPKPLRYTFFKLTDSTAKVEFLWLSVRFRTRTSVESKVNVAPLKANELYAHVTELDVGVFSKELVANEPPPFEWLSLAASCKLTACSRADVSNAEFLRGVTANRTGGASAPSRAAWAKPAEVPADPAIPVYLASDSANLTRWKKPLDSVGLYCRHVPL